MTPGSHVAVPWHINSFTPFVFVSLWPVCAFITHRCIWCVWRSLWEPGLVRHPFPFSQTNVSYFIDIFPSIFMCSLLYRPYYFLQPKSSEVRKLGDLSDDASPRRGRKWQGVTGSLWSCVYPRMSQANMLFRVTLQLDFSQPKQSDNCWNFFFPPMDHLSQEEGNRARSGWCAVIRLAWDWNCLCLRLHTSPRSWCQNVVLQHR